VIRRRTRHWLYQQPLNCLKQHEKVVGTGCAFSVGMIYRTAPKLSLVTSGKAELSYGMQGDAVKELQKRLGVTADGYFGPQTLAAVKAAQSRLKLTPATAGLVGMTSMSSFQRDSEATTKSVSTTQSADSTSQNSNVLSRAWNGAKSLASSVGSAASSTMTKLAENAKAVALSMGGYRGLGKCAKGFSDALQKTTGERVYGNGNQIDNNLDKSKYQQVNISLEEALKTPGYILTWDTTNTSLGKKYGHVAVTTGDGKSSASDFLESNTLAAESGRTGLRIYKPIAA
jgi:peptidoglycan hydrolase-like protein with peptidoglycan-binding domain